ncbi:hypothetical protein C0J52_09771 [Blattella germanica]|nr:hypothetical protein C0J52_09771 [Blattella germanica]
MTTKHSGAVFNHSCLKVPVNPTSQLPLPSFEQKKTFGISDKRKKAYRKNNDTNGNQEYLKGYDRPSSSDSRDQRSKTSTPQGNVPETMKNINETVNKGSVKSFLDFYESIPDYGDVNHLSDREFYLKLQYLKARQRTYLRDLNEKDVNAIEMLDDDNNKSTRKNLDKTWHNYNNIDFNLNGKKCDLDNKSSISSSRYDKKVKAYADSYDSRTFWNKDDKNYISPSPTISAVSAHGSTKTIARGLGISKPTIQLNNYLVDNRETRNKFRIGFEIKKKSTTEKENKPKSSIIQHEIHKSKAMKQHNIRDIHSASTNKAGDSSSSFTGFDSIYGDGLSIDDYIPKQELFSDSDSEQDYLLDVQLTRSMPNSPAFKQNKNVMWREPKITIPKPFNMSIREEEDRRLNLLNHQIHVSNEFDEPKAGMNIIRAHPVPIESQIPLFDKIMAEQENRRRQVRRQCMNELKAQMKPFKFVKRDEERKKYRFCHSSPDLRDIGEIPIKPFRAKPVPKNLFSTYVYQRMHEDEYFRNLKKKIRAEELLKASSLPPSMAARERLSKARALSAEILNRDPGRPKRKKHKIPNYRKSHEQIRRQLEDRWNDNITTSSLPFTLRTAELHKRKSARFMSPDQSSTPSPYGRYPSPVPRERVRPRSALGLPLNRNNLASVLRIQSSRQKLEKEITMKQDEIRKKEEARQKANVTRRKPAWQALTYSTEEDLAMRIQTRREEERMRREEYEREMELMLSRVYRIPTLFERQSQKQKRNDLKQFNKAHKKSRRRSGHSMKISSVPTTPDLYEEDEEDYENQDESSEKNIKSLRVSISETPETIECPSEIETIHRQNNSKKSETCKTRKEDMKEVINNKINEEEHDLKEKQDVEEKDEDEENDGNTSIQEDISADRITDDDDNDDDDDDEDDDEGGNTYNIDD